MPRTNESAARKSNAKVDVPELEQSVRDYIESRRNLVDNFVHKHFELEESIRFHKESARIDLIKHPLNVLLSVPLVFIRKIMHWLEYQGFHWPEILLHKLNHTMQTGYDKRIEKVILAELFEIETQTYLNDKKLEAKLSEEISDYLDRRAAFTDFSTSVVMLICGWLFAGKLTSSIIVIGERVAQAFAKKQAISNFFLGKDVGRVFYGIFPAHATTSQIITATLALGFIFVLIAYAANIFSDPLQKRLGLQHKKLHRALDSLEMKMLIYIDRQYRKSQRH